MSAGRCFFGWHSVGGAIGDNAGSACQCFSAGGELGREDTHYSAAGSKPQITASVLKDRIDLARKIARGNRRKTTCRRAAKSTILRAHPNRMVRVFKYGCDDVAREPLCLG